MLDTLKILIPAVLVLMPASVFLWNWKYHDRRKNFDQRLARGILIMWLILALGNGLVIWAQRRDAQTLETRLSNLQTQSIEIIAGKDEILRQNAALSTLVKSLRGQIEMRDAAIQQLQDEIAVVKRYSYVAGLTFNGMVYTKGDVIMPTEISQAIEGTWQEVGDNHFRPVCEAAALEKCRNATKQFPEFPFTYYALAYCLEKQGDPAWRPYAKKAAAILEKTTVISGHQKSHEQSLAYLQQLLERSE